MAHDLFISYSSKDKTTADAVCARMESGGIRCWYAPRDIQPGADWADSIIQAIDQSRVMVLIFTKDSNISKQVLREINYAVGAGVTIIPLRLTKEEHPCRKSKNWKVIRMGADIKIKCQGCGAVIMFPRHEFERKLKRVVEKAPVSE